MEQKALAGTAKEFLGALGQQVNITMWRQFGEEAGADLGFDFGRRANHFCGLIPLADGEAFQYRGFVISLVPVRSAA